MFKTEFRHFDTSRKTWAEHEYAMRIHFKIVHVVIVHYIIILLGTPKSSLVDKNISGNITSKYLDISVQTVNLITDARFSIPKNTFSLIYY